jgi:hypothetical protein
MRGRVGHLEHVAPGVGELAATGRVPQLVGEAADAAAAEPGWRDPSATTGSRGEGVNQIASRPRSRRTTLRGAERLADDDHVVGVLAGVGVGPWRRTHVSASSSPRVSSPTRSAGR